MPNNTFNNPKKTERFFPRIGQILFSDKILMRLLRIAIIIFIIIGWGVAGALIFEAGQDKFTITSVLRYALAPLAASIGAVFLGASYLQDVYELPRYGSALRYIFSSMFGLFLPSLNISDGKADATDDDINLIQRIGGPGWLSVEAGSVVLLEYLQKPARALGPGYHFVPRMQHAEAIFSLEDQRWHARPIVATTKDGIEIAVHDFQFGYRLTAPSQGPSLTKRTTTDPYPFYAKAVWKLAYDRSVRKDGMPVEWGQAAQGKLDSIITNFINKNSIDKILAPVVGGSREYSADENQYSSYRNFPKASGEYNKPLVDGSINEEINDKDESSFKRDAREILLNQLRSSHLQSTIRDSLGTDITWVNIGRFEIYDQNIGNDIKNYRLKAWFAHLAGRSELIRAEGKAAQISQRESGRIEKTTSMLRSILQALEDANLDGNENKHMWNIVLARTAQVVESMTSLYGIDIVSIENTDKRKE